MRAFVIGGAGLIGSAVCRRLLRAGWDIDAVGRQPSRLPADLAAAGVRFHALDRHDTAALARVYGTGADLLLDCACYTRAEASGLLGLAGSARSTVMISAKAVYTDAAGAHANSERAPQFEGAIRETQSTLPPGDMDHRSPEGYGPNKVAAEQVLLDSGLPVTVLRPSKVHGPGARPAREWVYVKRVLDRRPVVLLARRGRGVDHPCAAVNIAALVETVAAEPGRRILNIADPDAPSAAEIARIIAGHLGHDWSEIRLDDDAEPALGSHPWDRVPPVILDTTEAMKLGYQPVGDYAATVIEEIDWLTSVAERSSSGFMLPPHYEHPSFASAFEYEREDEYLRRLSARRVTSTQRAEDAEVRS